MAAPGSPSDWHKEIFPRTYPFSRAKLRALPTHAANDPDFRPESVLTQVDLAAYQASWRDADQLRRAFMARGPVANTMFTHDLTPLETRAQPLRAYPPLRFTVPVFHGIRLTDEQTLPPPDIRCRKRACAPGSNITIHMYPSYIHAGTVLRSQEDSLGWVKAVFDGKRPRGHCEKTVFRRE